MKIIGSDYDGTFSVHGVNENKIAAVKKWRDAGNKFGMVSGRGGDFRAQILNAYPELELDFFAMCNGGYITDSKGTLIYGKQCREVPIIPFAHDIFSCGCKHLNIVTGEKCLCALMDMNDRPPYVPQENTYLIKELPQIDAFYQISVLTSSVERTAEVVDYIREKYGEFLNPLQNGVCIDIVPSGVNKAQGLYRVMNFFGGKFEDVIALGDNFNDMDMMKEFRSYAMANGVDTVKAVALTTIDDVTDAIEMELAK